MGTYKAFTFGGFQVIKTATGQAGEVDLIERKGIKYVRVRDTRGQGLSTRQFSGMFAGEAEPFFDRKVADLAPRPLAKPKNGKKPSVSKQLQQALATATGDDALVISTALHELSSLNFARAKDAARRDDLPVITREGASKMTAAQAIERYIAQLNETGFTHEAEVLAAVIV
jgi:hypothetical protein